jgi:hypothetical protein
LFYGENRGALQHDVTASNKQQRLAVLPSWRIGVGKAIAAVFLRSAWNVRGDVGAGDSRG